MLALILATCCSATIALVVKHSEARDRNRYAVTSANYFAACAVSGFLVFRTGSPFHQGFSLAAALSAMSSNFGQDLEQGAGLAWAMTAGLGAGLFFFLALITYQVGSRRHGMSLPGAFMKLGALVPMTLSLLLWREWPGAWQWGAIGLAIFAILLVIRPEPGALKNGMGPLLLLICLFGGIAQFSNKVFQKYGVQENRALFLLFTFATALLCSLLASLRTRRPVVFQDLLFGFAIGVPNLFASYFLIMALATLPAAVAYPAFAAGAILLISLVDVLFFKARLRPREWIAVALIAVALFMVNL